MSKKPTEPKISNPGQSADLLHEALGGRVVGGTLSQLANYSDLFKRMSEAVFLLDRHSLRVLECNPAAAILWGLTEEELLGQSFPDLFPAGLVTLETDSPVLEKRISFKESSGASRHYRISINSLKILDYIEVLQCVVNDVTAMIQAQEQLESANSVLRKLSTTDAMTGLWNFRYFQEALNSLHQHALKAGEKFGVIFIDVDHFKKFNDQNGHPAGDEVLKKVAEIIKSSTGPHQIAARYGGEEFVVISKNSTEFEVQRDAERIRKAIDEAEFPHEKTQPLGRITASLGVAVFPAHGHRPEDILHRADLALYHSKEQGRNQVTLYDPHKVQKAG